jgi:Ca2+-transporting ATPase
MSKRGLKVLGIAYGKIKHHKGKYTEKSLKKLKLLSLAGMIDPLRPEAKDAIKKCKDAGIDVKMITGDNPLTAFAIAKNLNLISSPDKIVIGTEIKMAKNEGEKEIDELIESTNVFARIEPNQKLDIVDSMGRQGHFVAVTGDGVNDAPALKHTHVGVAMGKSGTDIARESADIIITDDNFASIVNGIEEGRISYSNIRKLIFLLVSAGIAEIAIFLVTFMFGLPIPFFAAQLLWLNIVTEGIQDVALSLEKGEGYEMKEKPRSPNEKIFNKLMIKRVILSVIVMTIGVVATYYYLINVLYWEVGSARNTIVMLMVLFENMQVFNSRSENCSLFKQSFGKNPYIIIGTLGAMLVHIAATYTPGLNTALKIHPIGFEEWFFVLMVSLSLIVVMEIEKWFRRIGWCVWKRKVGGNPNQEDAEEEIKEAKNEV